jgi:hypothetical protein
MHALLSGMRSSDIVLASLGASRRMLAARAAPCHVCLSAYLSACLSCSYWLRFMLLGVFELPLYALRRGRQAEAARAVLSMGANAAVVLLLARRCWVATLYTLVLPYLVSSLALMFGNW